MPMNAKPGPAGFFRENPRKLLLILSIILYAYALNKSRGVIYADSIFQVLEPAHRLVYGYGEVGFEFIRGIRPMAPVYFASLLLSLEKLSGSYDPFRMLSFLDLLTAVSTIILVQLAYGIGRHVYGREAGLYAGYFTLFSGFLILYGSRFTSDLFSVFFTTAAYYFTLTGTRRRHYAYSGLCVGLSYIIKFRVIVAAIPLTLYLVIYLRRKLGFFILGIAAAVLAQCLMDYVLWHELFHSPIASLTMNIDEGIAVQYFGSMPWYAYISIFSMHPVAFFCLLYSRDGTKKDIILFAAVFYTVFFSVIGHKEYRYMMPAIPFLMIAAGNGLDKIVRNFSGLEKKATVTWCLALAFITMMTVPTDFVGWGSDDLLRAARYVGVQNDSKGMAYNGRFAAGLGSYFIIHKKIPAVRAAEWEEQPPKLDVFNCSLNIFDPVLYDYQCIPFDEVVKEKVINYFIIFEHPIYSEQNLLIKPVLDENGFEFDMVFGDALVYKRKERGIFQPP